MKASLFPLFRLLKFKTTSIINGVHHLHYQWSTPPPLSMGQPNFDEERILTSLSSNSSNNKMKPIRSRKWTTHQGEVIMEKKVKHYEWNEKIIKAKPLRKKSKPLSMKWSSHLDQLWQPLSKVKAPRPTSTQQSRKFSFKKTRSSPRTKP